MHVSIKSSGLPRTLRQAIVVKRYQLPLDQSFKMREELREGDGGGL